MITLLLLFFAQAHFFAQSVSNELQKVRNAYMQSANMSFNVEVQGYKTKKDTKGFKIGKGSVVKSSDAYYSLYEGEEYLKTSTSLILIDHNEKEVMVFENKVSDKKVDKNSPVIVMDSVIKLADSIRYEGESGPHKKICIYDSDSPVRKTELYINKTSSYIEKIIYHYVDSDAENDYGLNRVIIQYKNITNTLSNPALLNESRVLNRKKKTITLTETYKAYKLIQNNTIDL